MALVLADRVQQTGTANTTVSFTLSATTAGYQSFAVVGNTNTTYYSATDTSGNWEVGVGTYSTTGPTLTRTTVSSSSNSGSAVTFVGTVTVFITYPSGKSVTQDTIAIDGSNNVTFAGSLLNPTVKNYTETAFTANTSTALTVSLTNGTIQILTLTANATITMPTAVAGKSFVIILRQDATGSRSVTWSTVNWPSATAPTITGTASKQDIFSFFSDGTSWYGTTIGQNYTQ
jgi:hypothetical protein